MSELREALEHVERAAGPAELPPDSHERFLRYRDRRRRNQRLAATVVAIAIVVAPISWFVAVDWSGRTREPLGPTPTVTPSYAPPVGLVGLAPEGAARSLPARGDLVLSFLYGHSGGDPGRFSVHLYADGRFIWERLGGGEDEHAIPYSTGILEQRLTPEGINLVRDAVTSTGLVDHDLHMESAPGLYAGQIQVRDGDRLLSVTWGDCCERGSNKVPRTMPTPEQVAALQQLDARFAELASWLPASAWEDPKIRAFVPSRYSVCYSARLGIRLSRVLAAFPQQAQELLGALVRTHQEFVGSAFDPPIGIWCSDVTTAQAHALDRSLDGAYSSDRHEDIFGVRYVFGQRAPGRTDITLSMEPLLPDQP